MVVKLANDGILQANDGEMLVNDGEMSVWSNTHFTIIDEHFTIIKEHFTIIHKHFTIIRSFGNQREAAPTVVYIVSPTALSSHILYNLEKTHFSV